jgi:hypothetical protein
MDRAFLLALTLAASACSIHSYIPAAPDAEADSSSPVATTDGLDASIDAPHADGVAAPGDAATPPRVDAADVPDAPVASGDICSGAYSAQMQMSYDEGCDNYYASGGPSNPCKPTANDCAALAGQQGFDSFCCFVPPSNSACGEDYAGVPQCVPK